MYEFAQRVWNSTGCETMGDYHHLYSYQDIFLLADIFEQICHVALKNYDLDPAHFYTVPGLAWDAALKYTKVKLETLHDIEMYQFLERGMRGEISMMSHRYAENTIRICKSTNLKSFSPISFTKTQTTFMEKA